MKAHGNLAIGIFVLTLAAAIFLLTPKSTESLEASARANAEEMSQTEGFSAVLEKAKQELELPPETDLSLKAKDAEYYAFSASSREGGGVEILAYRSQESSFEKVWEGQDYPNCLFVEQRKAYLSESEERVYTVPVSLVPRCFKTEQKDRTVPLERLISWLHSFPRKE